MKKLKLRAKLFLMAGILVAFATTISAVGIFSMVALRGAVADMTRLTLQTYAVSAIHTDLEQARVSALRYYLSREASDVQAVQTSIAAVFDRLESNRERLGPEILQRLEPATPIIREYGDAFQRAAAGDSMERMRILNEELNVLGPQAEEIVKGVQADLQQRAEAYKSVAYAKSKTNLQIICGVTGLSLTLGMILAYTMSRQLSRSVQSVGHAVSQVAAKEYDLTIPGTDLQDEVGEIARNLEVFRDRLVEAERASEAQKKVDAAQEELFHGLQRGLQTLAAGDFSPRIEVDTPAFEPLGTRHYAVCNDFNSLAESVGEVISAVEQSAETVSRGSSEISQMAQDLSKRSETQAATLEESAAALDQLTASVKSAADKAAEADTATEDNRRQAEASGEVVQSAITAMRQIEEGSSQITQIIGVIDDIAFQTNLLALNAGVEAARAGEAGRGFAVVASEVRALAQRASESAREIKGLISKSAAQVEEGGQLVGRTGTALEEIVAKVAQVSDLVSDIAASAKEQAAGLQEINTGVNQLDQVTQQNAAVVEEATAASQQLSDEARRLTAVLAGLRGGSGAEATGGGEVVTMDVRRPAETPSSAPKSRAAAGGSGASAPSSSGWEEF